jgi:hypothetical protein
VEGVLHNGQDQLGDTLIGLELVMPSEAVAVWAGAPPAGHEVYYQMSSRLQGRLRELIPFCYFQDPGRYDQGVPTSALILYSALAPKTGTPPHGPLHFDWRDRTVVQALVEDPATVMRLLERLARTSSYLKAIGKSGTAFQPKRAQDVVSQALSADGSRLLEGLLRMESVVIDGAAKAGAAMARFREEAATRPAVALEAMSKFGAELTDAFNDDVANVYAARQARALGTMLLLEAGRALGAPDVRPAAMLELTIVRSDAAFADYLAGKRPPESEVVLATRIVQA